MDEKTKEKYKLQLLELRKHLVGEYEKAVDQSSEEFGHDLPDVNDEASRTISRRIILEIGDKNFDSIQQIENALESIEEGDYGACEECGEDIPEKRLELLPYATLCVACKEEMERSER